VHLFFAARAEFFTADLIIMARGRHPTRIEVAPPDDVTAVKYLYRWCGGDLYRDLYHFPYLTSTGLFSNSRPLEVDFGCGNGELICNRAQQYPHVNFLGIDQSSKPLYCAVQTAANLNLQNIRFIRGDFIAMLPLLQPQTVANAYYLLPNPPRDYHIERVNARRHAFVKGIYDALVIGGALFFASDSVAYFEYICTILRSDIGCPIHDVEITTTEIRTQYLTIWQERGKKVHCCMVEKR
jgi:tRNA (guanine-N7-)-methyltransferase